jgi:hypothetical protein
MVRPRVSVTAAFTAAPMWATFHPQPLADAVEDHDRVVDGIARDGEQRGHHVKVEVVAGQAQCCHGDYQVVRGGNGRLGTAIIFTVASLIKYTDFPGSESDLTSREWP